MRWSNAALHASARHPTCRAAIGASHPYQPNWPTLSCRTPSLLYTRSPGQATSTLPQTVRDASNHKLGQACQRPSQQTRRQDPVDAQHAYAGPACPADLAGAQIGAASLRMPPRSYQNRSPPKACAERPRNVRAGQAQGARPPAQCTCQSTEISRAGRGREQGSEDPSTSAHIRLAGRGRLILLVAGRQEAVGAAAHAVVPLAPLLLPRHVLWPCVLRRVLCDARHIRVLGRVSSESLVSSARLQSAKPCSSDT